MDRNAEVVKWNRTISSKISEYTLLIKTFGLNLRLVAFILNDNELPDRTSFPSYNPRRDLFERYLRCSRSVVVVVVVVVVEGDVKGIPEEAVPPLVPPNPDGCFHDVTTDTIRTVIGDTVVVAVAVAVAECPTTLCAK